MRMEIEEKKRDSWFRERKRKPLGQEKRMEKVA
jgi:hypothetical protein